MAAILCRYPLHFPNASLVADLVFCVAAVTVFKLLYIHTHTLYKNYPNDFYTVKWYILNRKEMVWDWYSVLV